jgi:hypothetical protein
VNKVIAESNNSTNFYIITSSTAASSVNLSNSKANKSVSNMGFYIQAGGGVTIKSVIASENFNRGGFIDNGANLNTLVTTSIFNGNGSYGLEVNSNGNITLNGVTANDNNEHGVTINNQAGNGKIDVLSTLGENIFNNNTFHGLDIKTNGDVNLSKVTTNGNGFFGISVTGSGFSSKVTLNTVVSKENGRYGIYIFTTGKITVNKAVSLFNGTANNTDGLYVNTSSLEGVTISNCYFIGNEGNGIEANVIDPLTMVTIINTAYLGNDSDNTGDLDLNIY